MRGPAEFFCDRPVFDWQGQLAECRPQPAQLRQPTPEIAAEAASGCWALRGNSPGLHRVRQEIDLVAPTDATVLVLGETGVGKELVARNIHERSPRRDHPMVTVNCAAIPRELFESEFFGHVRGAFSGAFRDRIGRFQLADGGTLFLDEVGELPLEMQPKLLRVLQEAEFEAVGDERTRRVDVRIIAASNRDLSSVIRAGQFREDLYYRLNVFPIEVPPLRKRKDDIAILAVAFLEAACRRFNRPCPILTESDLWQLQNYEWPGNVRELQNVVERAVIGAHFGILRFDVPTHDVPTHGDLQTCGEANFDAASSNGVEVLPAEEMKRRERENIIAALRRSNGKIYGACGAAELLGVRPTTLNARVKKLGLKHFL